jgi:hypothetical protein
VYGRAVRAVDVLRREVFERGVVGRRVVDPSAALRTADDERAPVLDPHDRGVPAWTGEAYAPRVFEQVAPRCVRRLARWENAQALHPVCLPKVSRGRPVFDDGVPADADEGTVAEERAAGAERVAVHLQRSDGVGIEVVQRPPCGVAVDCQRVVLYLVENERVRRGDDHELHRGDSSGTLLYEFPAFDRRVGGLRTGSGCW